MPGLEFVSSGSAGSAGSDVDLTGLLPLDGSRAMTGPLELPGDATIDTDWSGITLRPADDGSGVYILAEDGNNNLEIYFPADPGGGVMTQLFGSSQSHGNWLIDSYHGLQFKTGGGAVKASLAAEGLVLTSPDGTAYKLTPPNGGGAASWVAA